MTSTRRALRFAALAPLFAVAACSAAPVDPAPTETARTARQTAALVAFDPCHPDWQLPTSARHFLDEKNPDFVRFEDILEAEGANWIGSFKLEKPYRAIVRVDHFLVGAKDPPHSALWYLAAVPAESYEARDAVAHFNKIAPVNSRILGFCAVDGTFLLNDGDVGPADTPIAQLVVEYDPRCICRLTPISISPAPVQPPGWAELAPASSTR
ncbi:MAG: hypothetical protein JST00_32940 [Deltaproteobacteria bacterium]|nr:hypothetical protein [Deltaproteobacteria bacterium]